MKFRAILPDERKYVSVVGHQIPVQTGLIGYMYGTLDPVLTKQSDSRFEHYDALLDTFSFKDALDKVFKALCENPDCECILKNRAAMSRFTLKHPEQRYFWNNAHAYGFRIDEEQYAFLLQINTEIKQDHDEFSYYCFCYIAKSLDNHIENAKSGIRFITPAYEEVFRIPDGDCVKVIRADESKYNMMVRYVDGTHFQMGGTIYHICQYAEHAREKGFRVIPLRSSLPNFCFHHLEAGNGEVIRIEKGAHGYRVTEYGAADNAAAKEIARNLNASIGVTPAQAEAMKAGSMFGWEVPAADPANYAEDGRPVLRR